MADETAPAPEEPTPAEPAPEGDEGDNGGEDDTASWTD